MTSTKQTISPISLIIPCRNEAIGIGKTIASARAAAGLEIIVVDGHSTDETVSIARQLGAKVLESPPGRARQMNAGAALAQGEILLFLHADTLLPHDFARQISTTLAQPGVVAGAFGLTIDLPGRRVRLLERMIRLRATWLQRPYGDQALFLHRQRFLALGGYPAEPILEDVLLIKRLRQCGRIAIAPGEVLTSGRRWQQLGLVKTTLVNQAILLAHLLGVSPQRLQGWYRSAQQG